MNYFQYWYRENTATNIIKQLLTRESMFVENIIVEEEWVEEVLIYLDG